MSKDSLVSNSFLADSEVSYSHVAIYSITRLPRVVQIFFRDAQPLSHYVFYIYRTRQKSRCPLKQYI